MAHNFLLPTTTILLILLFCSPPTTANNPVLDIDGNPLEAGSQYYILTSGRGAAGRGGLTSESKFPRLCPKYVAQIRFWNDNGKPVTFYPADSTQKEITQGTDVNIAFSGPNFCRTQEVWRLTYEEGSDVPYIATNGEIGNHDDAETFPNWFKIEPSFGPSSYRIVYCFLKPEPYLSGRAHAHGRVRGDGDENCQQLDANVVGPNGLSWLSLSPIDNPLPFFGFVFKKVESGAKVARF